jgi:zinc/manganese transport system ATP-binding protein
MTAAAQTTQSTEAIVLHGVSVTLNQREILSDLDLRIPGGEFVAILGPNGAGKTTLVKAMLGLTPTSGGVTVVGESPTKARSRVGYLPQRRAFDQSVRIRGLDLVRLGLDGTRWGVPVPLSSKARARHRAERHRVAEVVELVGASSFADRPLAELSGGEQQRLLIAQALVSRPEVLILDEPLDSLDLANQAGVAALVSHISRSEGITVLLVAHDVNPLLAYIDRVVYVVSGRALAGPVDEVINSASLSRLYGARIEVLRTGDGRLVVVGQPEAPHHHGHRHETA